jgi:hypothetical protein
MASRFSLPEGADDRFRRQAFMGSAGSMEKL